MGTDYEITLNRDANGSPTPAVWDPVAQQWYIPTQTVGCPVLEYQFHNALAIRDINNHDIGPVDIHLASGRKCIEVSNGCNQQVSIYLLVYAADGVTLLYTSPAQVIAANTSGLIMVSAVSALLEPLQQVTLRAAFGDAPAAGVLSTFIEAAPMS